MGMAGVGGFGGFVALVSRRLVRREPGGARRARQLVGLGLAGLAVASVGLGVGLRGPVVVGLWWLAATTALVATLVLRLRAMLVVAVLGLALGVASLFVVLGVASGIEGLLVGSLARLNGHAMISKYGLDFYEYDDVAATLEADPRVRAAAPFVFGAGAIVVVGRDESERSPTIVSIKGVEPEALAGFSGVEALFERGGPESLRPAEPRTRPGIVLGRRLARRIDADPGAVVRIVVPAAIRPNDDGADAAPRHGEFEVLGLLDTGFAEFDASFVLVHISAAQALVFGQRRASGIEVELEPEAAGLDRALVVAKDLVAGLDAERSAARLPPLYRASSWAERSATLISIRQTKALIVVVLSLIILVASGSLLGALLLLVRRERPHIGVLAALGARPSQLFWVFEMVGVGIGLSGAALGLGWGAISLQALAWLRLDLDPDVYMIDHLPVAFVATDLLVPAGLAVLVCAVVTGPVAVRVSRVRPIELLL